MLCSEDNLLEETSSAFRSSGILFSVLSCDKGLCGTFGVLLMTEVSCSPQ